VTALTAASLVTLALATATIAATAMRRRNTRLGWATAAATAVMLLVAWSPPLRTVMAIGFYAGSAALILFLGFCAVLVYLDDAAEREDARRLAKQAHPASGEAHD